MKLPSCKSVKEIPSNFFRRFQFGNGVYKDVKATISKSVFSTIIIKKHFYN